MAAFKGKLYCKTHLKELFLREFTTFFFLPL